ncbi:polyphosphate kinase 1 [Labilibaculum euxinus]|uniref:Polyphosphate kinase n=1 Tax=Labilibaculum euxinus TaxID=2686357 RepID=A0A7M4D6E8_9BACT|nr:polyphosphate kinase 1 [Labilibaculum euxinus]MUP38227.1 polyphosphate kinase 1 [Labilibaculum euxinus]MVB07432.1 polyphosphate kinase 1 [Labilibaculum euxinus]
MQKYQFLNRDLSWLSFNKRVLQEASNTRLPLYERIKFLAIYSSNLDEFYRVRLGTYKRFTELPAEDKDILRENPDAILKNINAEVDRQQNEFGNIFTQEIIPALEEEDIILIRDQSLCEEHHQFVKDFFLDNLLPHVQPILLLKKQIQPFLQNNVIYIAVKLFKKRKKEEEEGAPKSRRSRYAIIKVPSHRFPRFIELPDRDGKHFIMFLDDIIKLRMKLLFPGYKIDSSYSFKLSRDADLLIEDEYSGDLIKMIENSLKKRETGSPSRFLYDASIPKDFLKFLKDSFNLQNNDMVKGARYHNFQDFFCFPNPKYPELEPESFHPLKVDDLQGNKSVFKTIRLKDQILHFPYQSYEYVIRFLNEAAVDPKVVEIKATQYRVADNSAVVNALINAALNGKKVTVFVEVKARFDEEANLRSANEMRKAGVKIIDSIPGLKVHAKLALVLRKGDKKDYAFLSTGNFNEKTAKIYSDHGLLTSNEVIITELKQLFDYLENQTEGYEFRKLLVGRFNLRRSLIELIDQEIQNVKNGHKGYIILKMNGLQERDMITKLYEASEKGVKIDLIIRGICCLKPNKTYAKNIRIIRIVDQFLEHGRIFYFHNLGEELLYLSSADWMNRNLHRRIECAFPIQDKKIKKELIDILNIQLNDNVSARILDGKLNNLPIPINGKVKKIQSQKEIFAYLNKKETASKLRKNRTAKDSV